MRTLPYHTLDVFTRQRFAGNPLAVVRNADGLSPVLMQKIATEFNLSETVFVQAARGPAHAAAVRIFTPVRELPFAGHPTIGTAVLLAELGLAAGDALTLEQGAGPVRVSLRREADGVFAELAAVAPELRAPDFDVQALPAVLGVQPQAIRSVRLASCGNPFAVIELAQPELLSAIDFDAAAARHLLANSWAQGLYLVAPGYEGEWRTRMFAPGLGVTEDPATGSAAVAFAGALALEAPQADADLNLDLHQGLEMGRPSRLYARATRRAGAVTAVHVGGYAVRVGDGELRLPG